MNLADLPVTSPSATALVPAHGYMGVQNAPPAVSISQLLSSAKDLSILTESNYQELKSSAHNNTRFTPISSSEENHSGPPEIMHTETKRHSQDLQKPDQLTKLPHGQRVEVSPHYTLPSVVEQEDNESHEPSNHVSTQQHVSPVSKGSPSKPCMDASVPLASPTPFPSFSRKPHLTTTLW